MSNNSDDLVLAALVVPIPAKLDAWKCREIAHWSAKKAKLTAPEFVEAAWFKSGGHRGGFTGELPAVACFKAFTVVSEALLRTAACWSILRNLASIVIARDAQCIYCRREFAVWPRLWTALASWEHIVNDLALVSDANIALCCVGCNSSKGRKSLDDWLKSKYCVERSITRSSLGPIAGGGPAERRSSSSGAAHRDG